MKKLLILAAMSLLLIPATGCASSTHSTYAIGGYVDNTYIITDDGERFEGNFDGIVGHFNVEFSDNGTPNDTSDDYPRRFLAE